MFVLPDLYNTANTVTELFDGGFLFYSVDPIAPVKFDVHNNSWPTEVNRGRAGRYSRSYVYIP